MAIDQHRIWHVVTPTQNIYTECSQPPGNKMKVSQNKKRSSLISKKTDPNNLQNIRQIVNSTQTFQTRAELCTGTVAMLFSCSDVLIDVLQSVWS